MSYCGDFSLTPAVGFSKPSFTSRLIASERDGSPACFARHSSIASRSDGEITICKRTVLSSVESFIGRILLNNSNKRNNSLLTKLCKLRNISKPSECSNTQKALSRNSKTGATS